MKRLTGAAIATAAASLLLAGCESMANADSGSQMSKAEVHCFGINACKGMGACASSHNACKGHNSCKGMGWLPTASKADCEAKGGKVES
jgi:hypothetical protein